MPDILIAYYWAAFVVSFWIALKVPTRMNGMDNFIGSFFVGMFGFVLLPILVLAYIAIRRGGDHG